jgi:DNA polymerase III delta subunit
MAAPSAVHAIVGGKAFDSVLADEALGRVLDETLGSERGDAVSVLRGDETTWTRVLDAARTRSLFAARRVVVVRRAEALKGDGEGLAAYLDGADASGVILVLIAAKVDKRRGVWKLLLERAKVVVVEPLKERDLRRRVQDELRRRRLDIDPQGSRRS